VVAARGESKNPNWWDITTARIERMAYDLVKSETPAANISLLDWTVKLLALVGILVYVTGYIALNNYLSSFGIAEFQPLRGRVLATGLLLLSICGIGTLIWWSIVPTLKGALGSDSPARRVLANVVLNCAAITISITIYWFMGPAIVPLTDLGVTASKYYLIELASLVLTGITLALLRLETDSRKWWIATCTAGACGLLIAVTHHFPGPVTYLALLTFGSAISPNSFLLSHYSKRTSPFRVALCLMLWFVALQVTSRPLLLSIRPAWGGARPIVVAMAIFKQTGPFVPCNRVVTLLDETDAGFYISLDVTKRSAYFIPRSNVASIFYENLFGHPRTIKQDGDKSFEEDKYPQVCPDYAKMPPQ
jgi:hypothetical protein